MSKIGIVVCEHFENEIRQIIRSVGDDNLYICTFPPQCDRCKPSEEVILHSIQECQNTCSRFILLGGGCTHGLLQSHPELRPHHLEERELCFYYLTNPSILDHYLAQKNYLISPGWLRNWKRHIAYWGDDRHICSCMLKESTERLLLLDTGVDSTSHQHLQEFAEYIDLPYDTLPVGCDFFRLRIIEKIQRFHLQESQSNTIEIQKQLSDAIMCLDVVSRMNDLKTESDVIWSIFHLFSALCAPSQQRYLTFHQGTPTHLFSFPDDIDNQDAEMHRMASIQQKYGDTPSGLGFFLQIIHREEILGILEVDRLIFPAYQKRYLSLSHNIIRACALAVANARSYETIKQYENELQISERKYRLLVENQIDLIVQFNREGILLFSSPSFGQTFSQYTTELVGKNFLSFFPQEDARKMQGSIEKVSEPPHSRYIEVHAMTAKGLRWQGWLHSGILDSDNRLEKIVSVGRDITDLKQMEEELSKAKKLESVGVLAGGIAHDFNNLLMAIMGNVSFAKTQLYSNPEVEELLSEAMMASRRAQKLTQQLLTFSKGGNPIKTTTSIQEIVRETVHFSTRSSNVHCEFILPECLWQVDIDKGQFGQVIQNLTINALEAMPEGGVFTILGENLSIHPQQKLTTPGLHEGPYVKLSLIDHGMGIERENLKKVFDPYFTTKDGKSGLGLAVVYSIIQKHNGVIIVDSIPNQSTTFSIYLPAHELHRSTDSLDQSVDDNRPRILVMDDESMIRILLKNMLLQFGYQCDLSADGLEAIEKYRSAQMNNKSYDLVIMDLTIPGGVGGEEAIREILKIDPTAKVIVSSGYSNNPIMANYKEHGFYGVITKPYDIDELEKILDTILEYNTC